MLQCELQENHFPFLQQITLNWQIVSDRIAAAAVVIAQFLSNAQRTFCSKHLSKLRAETLLVETYESALRANLAGLTPT